MEFTDLQKQSVKDWVKEGCGLSDIQKRVSEKFGVSMTYMDVRLLVLEMGLELKEKSSGKSNMDLTAAPRTDQAGEGGKGADSLSSGAKPKTGGVSVAVDRVTAPGSLVSGSVTFSDGISATWRLDQFGRLALSPGKQGYNPSREDVQSFQKTLSDELMRLGF